MPPVSTRKFQRIAFVVRVYRLNGRLAQPNVITPDQKAGVQVGELVLVTERGFEGMHGAERGLFRL